MGTYCLEFSGFLTTSSDVTAKKTPCLGTFVQILHSLRIFVHFLHRSTEPTSKLYAMLSYLLNASTTQRNSQVGGVASW